jgi:hypothetical protein
MTGLPKAINDASRFSLPALSFISLDEHLEIVGAPDKQSNYNFAKKANPRSEPSMLFSKPKSLPSPRPKLLLTFATSSGSLN